MNLVNYVVTQMKNAKKIRIRIVSSVRWAAHILFYTISYAVRCSLPIYTILISNRTNITYYYNYCYYNFIVAVDDYIAIGRASEYYMKGRNSRD